MKIAVCSDLHLEFVPLTLENPGAEVLILSGDIIVERDLDEFNLPQIESGFARHKSTMYHAFFEECCAKFPNVIYVAGNHEHYHGDFKYTLSELKKKLGHLENLHILDKETVKIGDTHFVGGTLWTDMNKEDPLTLYHIKSMMNDFRCVQNSNRVVNFKAFEPIDKPVGMSDEEFLALPYEQRFKTVFKTRTATFSPEDAVEENKKCFEFIQHVVSECPPWEQVVVVGHHTPSQQSCHPRYADDQLMNGGYHNSYENYIMEHPQIKLWTHGHTHERYDYMIGDTRVVCNPRGYKGYEDIAEDFELKVVEL
jgi:predicted phosphodiesterase